MMGWRGGWLAEGAADAKSQAISGWTCKHPLCPGFQAGTAYYKVFGDPKSGPRQISEQAQRPGGKLMCPQAKSCYFCGEAKADTKSLKSRAKKQAAVDAAREASLMSLQEVLQEAARKKEEVCMQCNGLVYGC